MNSRVDIKRLKDQGFGEHWQCSLELKGGREEHGNFHYQMYGSSYLFIKRRCELPNL